MRKVRIVLLVIAVLIAIWQVVSIDYSNLSSRMNIAKYIMIISMLLLCTSMLLTLRREEE